MIFGHCFLMIGIFPHFPHKIKPYIGRYFGVKFADINVKEKTFSEFIRCGQEKSEFGVMQSLGQLG